MKKRISTEPVGSNVGHCVHRLSIGERFDNLLDDTIELVRGERLVWDVEHPTVRVCRHLDKVVVAGDNDTLLLDGVSTNRGVVDAFSQFVHVDDYIPANLDISRRFSVIWLFTGNFA